MTDFDKTFHDNPDHHQFGAALLVPLAPADISTGSASTGIAPAVARADHVHHADTIGFQGTQGSTGAQGFQGVRGFQGFQGVAGSQGFQGFQGIAGSNGAQGAQGSSSGGGFIEPVTFTQPVTFDPGADIVGVDIVVNPTNDYDSLVGVDYNLNVGNDENILVGRDFTVGTGRDVNLSALRDVNIIGGSGGSVSIGTNGASPGPVTIGFGGDLAFHAVTPVPQAAHPTTLSDVITILTDLGLCM